MQKMNFWYAGALLLSLLAPPASAQITIGNTAVDTSTVIGGIDIPWEIVWGPDNHIWMTERYGRISRVNPQTGQQSVLLTLSDCYATGESGLLGMALYPNFTDTSWVFFAYTYQQSGQIRGRLVRYTYDSSAQSLVNPLVLINNIPGNTTHNGARLLFLPDNTLLMTTGDAQNQQAPLNPALLPGKVLRLHTDGSIPANNPTSGSYVYTLGHRNAQGMFQHPNGRIYISEHGPSSDDELNIVAPGRNYGWPTVNGMCNTPAELQYCFANNVYEPIRTWTPTIAPAGMIWYNHPALPVFQNKIILTTLKDARLYVLTLNGAGDTITSETQYLNQMFGRLRDVIADPDGNLYLATNGNSWVNSEPFTHRIVKLSPRQSSSVAEHKQPTASVFPNPLVPESRLRVDASLIGSTARLMDLHGRLLHQFEVTEEENQLNFQALQPGIYYLQLPKLRTSIKLVVLR